MKPNHMYGGYRIEILRVWMEKCLERKNHKIMDLENKIAEAEKDAEQIHSDLWLREESLRRLRVRREVEEIKCFEEISRIHKEITNIAESISQADHT